MVIANVVEAFGSLIGHRGRGGGSLYMYGIMWVYIRVCEMLAYKVYIW